MEPSSFSSQKTSAARARSSSDSPARSGVRGVVPLVQSVRNGFAPSSLIAEWMW